MTVDGIRVVYTKHFAYLVEDLTVDVEQTPDGADFVVRSPADTGC